MSKRKRILIWIGATLLLVFAYLWLFGIQTAFALMAWNTGRQIPELSHTPRELDDLSVSHAQSLKFTRCGYEFELPWTDVDQTKTKIIGKGCIITFHSGIRVTFSADPARSTVTLVASKSGGEESLRRRFGDEAVFSDYNFYQLMLNTTPASVRVFTSREAASRNSSLLTLKAIAMPDPGHSGIYSIRTANFQGFQYGAAGNSRRMVVSDLLDDQANAEFIFFDAPAPSPPITQADINFVTQSLKRTSTAIADGTAALQVPSPTTAR